MPGPGADFPPKWAHRVGPGPPTACWQTRSPPSWQHWVQLHFQEHPKKRTVGAPPERPFQTAGTGSPGQREVEPGILGEPRAGGGHGPVTHGYQTWIIHPSISMSCPSRDPP
ncbi:unnamed protein product [Rangifer tarandus platyrhynchus]|uniref:Uncharacterized protein n=2 Tax=Rangifer tarandus platyrhynchus TaxID=3082113 RepID=A0ABN8ZJL4_RANTA|nr:unnamed protein product [Rangifer tarandus platyrhynchus]